MPEDAHQRVDSDEWFKSANEKPASV
jgi:hypothetical protein